MWSVLTGREVESKSLGRAFFTSLSSDPKPPHPPLPASLLIFLTAPYTPTPAPPNPAPPLDEAGILRPPLPLPIPTPAVSNTSLMRGAIVVRNNQPPLTELPQPSSERPGLEELTNLMKDCWSLLPENRPSFRGKLGVHW